MVQVLTKTLSQTALTFDCFLWKGLVQCLFSLQTYWNQHFEGWILNLFYKSNSRKGEKQRNEGPPPKHTAPTDHVSDNTEIEKSTYMDGERVGEN